MNTLKVPYALLSLSDLSSKHKLTLLVKQSFLVFYRDIFINNTFYVIVSVQLDQSSDSNHFSAFLIQLSCKNFDMLILLLILLFYSVWRIRLNCLNWVPQHLKRSVSNQLRHIEQTNIVVLELEVFYLFKRFWERFLWIIIFINCQFFKQM